MQRKAPNADNKLLNNVFLSNIFFIIKNVTYFKKI